MRYTVRIGVEIAVGAEALNSARSHSGACRVLEQLSSIASIQGPGGVLVLVHTAQVTGHRRGVLVDAVAEAPSASSAETGLRLALARLLRELPETARWRVVECRADPLAPGSSAAAEEAEDETDSRAARRRLLAYAPRLRAFGPEMFGAAADEDDPRCAELLAGALLVGTAVFFDGLYRDLDAMRGGATAGQLPDPWVLGELPAPVAARCDLAFARRFLLVGGVGAHRLVQPLWQSPTSFAEALAVRTMFQAGYDHLVCHRLLADPVRYFATLTENAFDHAHLEWMALLDRERDPLGTREDPWRLSTWFDPVNPAFAVHPYACGPAPV